MSKVYVHNTQVLNALGNKPDALLHNLLEGQLAIHPIDDVTFLDHTFYAAPLLPKQKEDIAEKYQKVSPYFVEQAICTMIDQLSMHLPLAINDKEVIVLISSTKGNIRHLSTAAQDVPLYKMGERIQQHYQLAYTPKVYSTACISGTQAIIQASRYLSQDRYQFALVIGIDELSPFVFKGFNSFHAIDQGFCKPFDVKRKGINLGEAVAGILLGNTPLNEATKQYIIAGGGMSNDANHLSAPSKTGDELALAITKALNEAQIDPKDVAMISAHGTATAFNDEMESKAMAVAQVSHAPVYSLKSYLGHTLGAAGILETIMGIELMKQSYQLKSLHFETTGTPIPLNVITKSQQYPHSNFLKTASGFGGCNAAIIVQQITL